jgi:hypothetical protein
MHATFSYVAVRSVHTYVDGELSCASTDHKSEDITLHPKFMLMGGGKQTEARGGNVRTIVLYDGVLAPAEVKEAFARLCNENPLYFKAVVLLQRTARGFVGRRKARVEKRLAGWVETEPATEGEKEGEEAEGEKEDEEEEGEENEDEEGDEEVGAYYPCRINCAGKGTHTHFVTFQEGDDEEESESDDQ